MRFLTHETAQVFYDRVNKELGKELPFDVDDESLYIGLQADEQEDMRRELLMEKEVLRQAIIDRLMDEDIIECIGTYQYDSNTKSYVKV